MAIVWDERLKRNVHNIGVAFDPKMGSVIDAGMDIFESVFLDMEEAPQKKHTGKHTGCATKWFQRFREDPSGIHLVIGRQRSGKTALCFYLAQATQRDPIYAITAASEVPPGVQVIDDIQAVPAGGICIIDDAQLFFNSMRVKGDDYIILRNLTNMIEKNKICLIFNTHEATLLQNTPISAAKTLLFKELGIFGAETERGYIRSYAKIAHEIFQKFKVPDRVKYTVIFDMRYGCMGVAKTPLISKKLPARVISATYYIK